MWHLIFYSFCPSFNLSQITLSLWLFFKHMHLLSEESSPKILYMACCLTSFKSLICNSPLKTELLKRHLFTTHIPLFIICLIYSKVHQDSTPFLMPRTVLSNHAINESIAEPEDSNLPRTTFSIMSTFCSIFPYVPSLWLWSFLLPNHFSVHLLCSMLTVIFFSWMMASASSQTSPFLLKC